MSILKMISPPKKVTSDHLFGIIREIRADGLNNRLPIEKALELERTYEEGLQKYKEAGGTAWPDLKNQIIKFPETTMDVVKLNLSDLVGMKNYFGGTMGCPVFDTGLVYSLSWDSQFLEIVSSDRNNVKSNSYGGSFCARMRHVGTKIFERGQGGFGPRRGLLKTNGRIC